MSKKVRVACIALLLIVSMGYVFAAGQKDTTYPAKEIHMVIPWAAGGGTDSIGRALAAAMEEQGITVVVDNIQGAAGITGSIKVATAKPDGYTILMNGDTDFLSALVFTDVAVPLTLDDFVYVGGFYETPTWILSHADSGITSMEQFLAKAKANPGKVALGSGTPAGGQMVMAAAIKGQTGLDMLVIPYQSGNDMKKALLGNQVDAGIIHSPVLLPEVEAGLINVIGTGDSLKNITYAPVRNTKTLKEIGVDLSMGITRGVYVPKDTPKEIVDALTAIVEKAAYSDLFKKFGDSFGFAPTWIPGPTFEKNHREGLGLFVEVKEKYIN